MVEITSIHTSNVWDQDIIGSLEFCCVKNQLDPLDVVVDRYYPNFHRVNDIDDNL